MNKEIQEQIITDFLFKIYYLKNWYDNANLFKRILATLAYYGYVFLMVYLLLG